MLASIFLQVKSFFMQHPVAIGFAIVLFVAKDNIYNMFFLFINQTLSSWPRAVGITKDYVAHHKDNRFYSPIVTFTANGQEYTFTDNAKYGVLNPVKNKKITVLYNPQNPQDAQVKYPLFGYNFFIMLLFLIIVYTFAVIFDSETNKQFTSFLSKFIPLKTNDDPLIIIVAVFFSSIGIFMLVMILKNHIGKIKIIGEYNGGKSLGKNNKGSETWNQKIKYLYEGKEYECEEISHFKAKDNGAVEIIIDPENPYDAAPAAGLLGACLFASLFILFPIVMLLLHFFTEKGFG